MSKNKEEKEESKPVVARTLVDIQRIKLEKLMKNPEKAVIIPEKPKERGAPVVPDFVRNVMGSSAGAGSGEFHVYRHLRRKEYARQHYMNEKAKWEKMEDEYHGKIEENKRKAEEETAKKRTKRLKKKQNRKKARGKKKLVSESESEELSEEENEDIEKAIDNEANLETVNAKREENEKVIDNAANLETTNEKIVGEKEMVNEKSPLDDTITADENRIVNETEELNNKEKEISNAEKVGQSQIEESLENHMKSDKS